MFTDPYLANVTIFAGNFAPLYWAFCNGTQMSIAANTALYSLIGTTYGGDGQTYFNLPDLRGRIAIHQGQGPGLSLYVLGELGGAENVTLLSSNLPSHTHNPATVTGTPAASSNAGNQNIPGGNVPAKVANNLYSDTADGFGMGASAGNATSPIAGSSQPVPTLAPYLAMNYIICVEGIYPSRN